MNALVVNKLEKTYNDGKVKALKGVSLEVAEGSFYGLLGPNGAGKSTLIHSITGLVLPTGGNTTVFGKDAVASYQDARKLVGFAPQEINLDRFLTVEGTLDYHGRYFGMQKEDRKKQVEKLLKIFSLTSKKNTLTFSLSGGMKRRVVIARALMHKPKLLILDEPTAGVDVELRHELWEYMTKLNKEGTTILLTTHYIEEAEKLCDKISLINHGRLIKTGTVEELKKIYKKRTLEDVYLEAIHNKNTKSENK